MERNTPTSISVFPIIKTLKWRIFKVNSLFGTVIWQTKYLFTRRSLLHAYICTYVRVNVCVCVCVCAHMHLFIREISFAFTYLFANI